jgi:zinc transport system substrate-binding protein
LKKVFSLILAALCLVLLCSCGTAAGESDTTSVSVITTVFPQYDFARQVGGELVSAQMLLPPGAESHDFEPTPQDIIAIQNCDLFIYVGGESDTWVENILGSMGSSAPKTLALMDCVNALDEEITEGMHAHEDENDDAEYDEHVWTSPKNAMLIAQAIAAELSEIDPDNAASYAENLESYLRQLSELDSLFEEVVSTAARKTVVVGDRFPFRYLAAEYGIEYYAAFPGCSGESEPAAKTLAFLIDKIKDENIPAVFYIDFSNGNIASAISETTGCEELLLHSCHSVTKQQLQDGVTYIELMEQNAENLRKALN